MSENDDGRRPSWENPWERPPRPGPTEPEAQPDPASAGHASGYGPPGTSAYGYGYGYGYGSPEYPRPPRASGLTITALVLGIVAVVASVIPVVHFVAFVIGLAAIVLGIVGLARRQPRRGFSIAGLVTGVFALLFASLWTVAAVALFGWFSESMGDTAAYRFEAIAETPATATYTATLEDIETVSVGPEAPFSEELQAHPMFGSITVVSDGGSGRVGCRILDAEGAVVAEEFGSGPKATAQCDITDF
ncbi:DUF4190 domain-containing protein [Zhihengliuella sp.]|uniref:DUF4190 domain-containing protein n=1 Tax=Zhihengliuella sp. TaxID=1954483 RepID=UPI002810CA02|nr:DUF4190 domain-containing protein [Zhihengliuella sp.]